MPLDSTPALSLVIPTRNEVQNVQPLIGAVCAAVPGASKELIFVDDSDDDTPQAIQRSLHEADCPGVLLQRSMLNRGGGLATAVVRGFQMARGDLICTLDADLQHPASAIPLLVTQAERTEADVVVASRYLSRRVSAGFDGRGRWMVSLVARGLARAIVPVARETSDPLSGFFLLRREVIAGVELRPTGYKILLEVLARGRWSRIADVPYAFHSRNAGVSKATMREGARFALHLGLLRTAGRTPAIPRDLPLPDEFRRTHEGVPALDGGTPLYQDHVWTKDARGSHVES